MTPCRPCARRDARALPDYDRPMDSGTANGRRVAAIALVAIAALGCGGGGDGGQGGSASTASGG
ncbi:MAG TPA: hypothetical protein VHB21_18530, partial [Minicystis sp.]|nr:hypothetical protein [Minicystis sp.]